MLPFLLKKWQNGATKNCALKKKIVKDRNSRKQQRYN